MTPGGQAAVFSSSLWMLNAQASGFGNCQLGCHGQVWSEAQNLCSHSTGDRSSASGSRPQPHTGNIQKLCKMPMPGPTPALVDAMAWTRRAQASSFVNSPRDLALQGAGGQACSTGIWSVPPPEPVEKGGTVDDRRRAPSPHGGGKQRGLPRKRRHPCPGPAWSLGAAGGGPPTPCRPGLCGPGSSTQAACFVWEGPPELKVLDLPPRHLPPPSFPSAPAAGPQALSGNSGLSGVRSRPRVRRTEEP